jgi:hypothetical protein
MKDVKEYLTQKRSEDEPLSGDWALLAELYDKRSVAQTNETIDCRSGLADLNSSIFYIEPTVLSPQIAVFHRCIRKAIDLVHYYELIRSTSQYILYLNTYIDLNHY